MKLLFSEEETRRLLARDEGQFLEFKSLWDLSDGAKRPQDRRQVRDWIAEYVAAFANADGGTLMPGVDDDGTPSGYDFPEEEIAKFLAVPDKRLRPAVRVASQRIALGGLGILIIQVPISLEAVMVDGNGFPYRVNDQVIMEPQEVINARKEAYRRVGFESRVHPTASIEDLDLDLARDFLRTSAYGDRPTQECLEAFGLLMPKAGGTGVTQAALLLFGKRPGVRWHPRAGVRLFRVHGTEVKHGAERNVSQLPRCDPPLASLITEAYGAALGQIRKSEKLHNLFFKEMPEYPAFAWQEALVNAVAHRDYNDQGREVEMWFFDDRMEVRNPGEPVPPVTLELLQNRTPIHSSRNPLIVRVFAEAGLMREEGEGIPRMFEEMEASLLKPPRFAVDKAEFSVTLFNQPAFEGPSPEWIHLLGKLRLSPNQRRVLLAHPSGFTNEDYRALAGTDRDRAYKEIQAMIGLGVIEGPAKTGRGAIYHLSSSLLESGAWLEARLPLIREHFKGNPHMTNADFRRLFQVSRHAALRELRKLSEQGFVKPEGERRGARYFPGSALG